MRVSNPYKSSVNHDAIKGFRNVPKPWISFKMVTIMILLLITAVMCLVHFHTDNLNGIETYDLSEKIIKLRGSKNLNNAIDNNERNQNNIHIHYNDRSKSKLNNNEEKRVSANNIENKTKEKSNTSSKIDRISTENALVNQQSDNRKDTSLSIDSKNKTVPQNQSIVDNGNESLDISIKKNIMNTKTVMTHLEQQNISTELKKVGNYDTTKVEANAAIENSSPNNLEIASPTSLSNTVKESTLPYTVIVVKPPLIYKNGETACDYPGLDPFKNEPVETFVPPITAPIASIHKWEDSLHEMISGISHMNIGGALLRDFMQKEVRRMQELRFNLFCKYM